MDNSRIIELENFLYKIKEKPAVAAEDVANIIGVLIDLKPAMIGDFEKNELKNIEFEEFEKLLKQIGLETVHFEHSCRFNGKEIVIIHFCISKKKKLAEQTHKTFIELWSTIDNNGGINNRRKWVIATKKVGKLLGYPKTAINSFVKDNDLENKDRIERMKRNRYYAHSAKYEDREFRMYDQKLNKAISDFAPKTASLLTENKEKRWLV
ncbi:hypothetical protein IKF28_02185 [Candidatus Saccharibacteria bacterium]|nr:hypothetical protein [Candidatus Saccharibacteria bacterium]MBR3122233.1 hypothetical protein [Candidatus Saccharibacteria bacterium]